MGKKIVLRYGYYAVLAFVLASIALGYSRPESATARANSTAGTNVVVVCAFCNWGQGRIYDLVLLNQANGNILAYKTFDAEPVVVGKLKLK